MVSLQDVVSVTHAWEETVVSVHQWQQITPQSSLLTVYLVNQPCLTVSSFWNLEVDLCRHSIPSRFVPTLNLFCGTLTEARCVKMENLKAFSCVGGCSKKGHTMAEEKKPSDLCINVCGWLWSAEGEIDKIAASSYRHTITECSLWMDFEIYNKRAWR